MDRIFRYLLHNTHACDRVLEPGRLLPIGEPDSAEVSAGSTVECAMNWLDAEYATVTAAIRRAHDTGHDHYTWPLAMVLVTYQWRTGRYADAERYLGHAAQAADRSAGAAVRALVRRALGGSLRGLGDRERAKVEMVQAIALAEEGGDEGALHTRTGGFPSARHHRRPSPRPRRSRRRSPRCRRTRGCAGFR
jgi:hypothetical protein